MQLVPFKTPLTLETGVVLLKYRALLVSDAAIYLDVPSANTLVKEGAEAAGIWQRMGPITPQLFEQYPKVVGCGVWGGVFVGGVVGGY